MIDLRQSPQYGEYMKKIGWQVEKADSCQIFIKKIPLLGSFIKIQRPDKIPFSRIEKLAKEYRAFAVCLEPNINEIRDTRYEIQKHGFRLNKSPYLPSKTLQIDLNLPEEKILAQMKKDARYSIRKAEKEEIEILRNGDIEEFHQAWKKHNHRRLWIPSLKWLKALKDSFGKDFFQLNAKNAKSEPILAGMILLKHDKIMYYYYAFSSKEGQRLFAPYLLVWEGIKLAKEQGCQIFDFEGIEDPRFKSTKSWRGFSHFKKSFGGKEIEYPGSFSKYYLLPLRFLLN